MVFQKKNCENLDTQNCFIVKNGNLESQNILGYMKGQHMYERDSVQVKEENIEHTYYFSITLKFNY